MGKIIEIEFDLDRMIEVDGLRSTLLIKEMKEIHGLRCLPTLLKLLGDGDWSAESLFNHFKLTSLVKATYQVRKENVVIDDRFLERLEQKCFWHLSRQQLFRVADEILFLFPERFSHVKRWIEEVS